MNPLVSVRKCADYSAQRLEKAVRGVLDDLGGLASFVRPGDRVLLKPNLLTSAAPAKAVVTHPAFVECVAAMVIDLGARPFLGDSPALGNLHRVLSKSGYDPFMKRMDVAAVPFGEKAPFQWPEDRLFKHLEIANEVFQFDTIINLAKVKTHCQMFLTLGVKNLFGTIIGMDKASLHLTAGKDWDTFATVLVQIYDRVRPALSLVDGVLAMEGDGPNSGDPRQLGIVAGSKDAIALDATLCGCLGLPVDKLRTCVIGQDLGVGIADKDLIQVVGDPLNEYPLQDFKAPKSSTMAWNLSPRNPIRKFLENHLTTRPVIDAVECNRCGICLSHCPPRAIDAVNGTMVVNRKKCISCFCCHELCSSNAVKIVRPLLGRVLYSVSR